MDIADRIPDIHYQYLIYHYAHLVALFAARRREVYHIDVSIQLQDVYKMLYSTC